MNKNDTQNRLKSSLSMEENVIDNKDIGLDKFSAADKIFRIADNKLLEKKLSHTSPGKRKTIYLSLKAISTIKQIGSRVRKLDIESNDSKIIATAIEKLNSLNETELLKVFEHFNE